MFVEVSIIIVNYNTKELTKRCIDSIVEKTEDVSYEIIIVDNASTDGSKDVFEKDSRITYIYSNENLGFGKANNLGYSRANGEFLFCLNSDTILKNNAVKIFYSFMYNSSPQIACCGCFLKNSNLQTTHSYGRFHTFWNSIAEWCLFPYINKLGYTSNKYDYPVKKNNNVYIVEFITGADVFIRKNIVDKYGLFDSAFFMYNEDVELAKRYKKKGYESVLIDGPQIVHLQGASFNITAWPKRFIALKSLFLYMKKDTNRLSYYIFIIVFKLFYCLSLLGRRHTLKDKYLYIIQLIKL